MKQESYAIKYRNCNVYYLLEEGQPKNARINLIYASLYDSLEEAKEAAEKYNLDDYLIVEIQHTETTVYDTHD